MDVVLLSSRNAGQGPHWSRAVAGAVADELLARGARVRWLCPLQPGEPPPATAAAIERVALAAAVPPFRSVTARAADTAADVALAHALRARPADVVVHVGFGAPGTVTSLWLGDRMGAHVVAAVRAAEVLCHRGTLVHASGTPCAEFLDPVRCARCCTTASPAGPSRGEAALAKCFAVLGAWSPFPSPVRFQNRSDLMLASLQLAVSVVTTDAEDVGRLTAAGLPPRALQVAAAPELAGAIVAAALAAIG